MRIEERTMDKIDPVVFLRHSLLVGVNHITLREDAHLALSEAERYGCGGSTWYVACGDELCLVLDRVELDV